LHKIASNSIDVRIYNRILIRNIIRKMGPIARYELAKETGLTPPTITAIVNELMEDGIVMEVGYGENISNAAALAEKESGCGRGYHNLVYLNLSVGIGAGIIIDDKLYGGSRGYAGEIGHMLLYEPQFSKGQISYFESIFGFGAIIERIKEKLPAEVFSEYGLNKSRLKAGDFLSSPIMERKEVQEILEESARGIGITVANLVSIFNPELIILGGELPKVSEKFVDIVIQEMNKHVLEEFVGTVKVVNSTMKDDPPLIGAYALALDMLFSIEKWNL
jgi:predicted NBD/HSP70 family sugar kinase